MNREHQRLNMVTRLGAIVIMANEYRRVPPLWVIAERIGVSQRTARRYVQALEESGLPLRWRKAEES